MVQNFKLIVCILWCLIRFQVNGNGNECKKTDTSQPNIWENKHQNLNFNYLINNFDKAFMEFKMSAKTDIEEISRPEVGINLRSGGKGENTSFRMKDTMQVMISEARGRATDLVTMSICIRKKVSKAVEEADEGIIETRKCIQKSVDKSTATVVTIIKKLEEHIISLTDIAAKVTFDLLECRKNEQQVPCVRKTLTEGEKLASAEASRIKSNLSEARLSWKDLVRGLRNCFISALEHGSVFEKTLRKEILECMS